MEFRRFTRKVELLSPSDFRLDIQEIEYREDPLTNSRSIINVRRARRAKQAQKPAVASDLITGEAKEGCFFCPEQIEARTPKFPPAIWAEGRIKRGECTVFPNLFPFAEYHAVGTISNAHFLNLDEFSPEMVANNMLACQEWMLSVHRKDSSAKYPMYIWNHMPPSGASIVHPHVQVLVRQMPTAMQEELFLKSDEYFKSSGRNYWLDLIEEERKLGERYIGENDSLAVIASYAPRGFREIQLIFKEANSFADLNEKRVKDFADAATKVLRGYKEMGVGSFNLNTFSGPIRERQDYYLLNAKVISRPFPQGVYTSDTGTFERLQDEWVIETLPEDVAEKMRAFFSD